MSTSFTHVTVRLPDGSDRDFSLPSDAPIAEYLPMMMQWSHYAIGREESWVLSTVEHGVLLPRYSLAGLAIDDGHILYLVDVARAPKPPFYDRATVSSRGIRRSLAMWRGDIRDRVLAAVLVAAVTALAIWAAVDLPTGTALGVLVVLAGAVSVGGLAGRDRELRWCAAALVPLMAAAGGVLADAADLPPVAVTSCAAMVGVAMCAAIGVVRPRTVGVVAACAAAVFAVMVAVMQVGGSAIAWSAWSVPALVLMLVVAPRLATSSGGLLPVVNATYEGELASRTTVEHLTRRTVRVLDTAVWTSCLLLGAAMCTVASTDVWLQGILVPVTAVSVILIGRAYTWARHVVPCLLTGLVGLLVSAVTAPTWLALSDTASAIVIVGFVCLCAVALVAVPAIRLSPPNAAQLARFYDFCAMVAVVGLVPVTFLAQGVYQFYWPK